MQSRKPAAFNVVPEDNMGTTWSLPEGAIARLGKGSVNQGDIKVSPDGTYFAVGTLMGLWWYDVSSMSPISLWETKRGMVNSIDFSHDGKWIIIDTSDDVTKVLDVQSGECIRQMEGLEAFGGLACSSNGKWIATAAMRGVVKVLDIHSGECVAQMDRGAHEFQSNDIHPLEFSPDGKLLAATAYNPELSRDGQVLNPDTEGIQTYVWHPETGEIIVKFAGRNFVFSPDGQLLAGAAADETMRNDDRVDRCVSVWDVTTGERVAHFTGHSDWVNNVTFSPCGGFLVSSSRDKSLRVWDVKKGTQKMVCPDFEGTWVKPFYAPEGELLVIVERQDTIEVWNIECREKLYTLELPPRSIYAKWFREFPQQAIANKKTEIGDGHTSSTLREYACYPDPVMFLPDGATLAAKGYGRGVVLWDVRHKQARKTVLENKRIASFTVLPCGNMLVGTSRDRNVTVWDAEKHDEPIAEFTEQTQSGWRMVFAPTGDRLAVGSREGTIYLYDLKHNEKLKPLTGHTDLTWSVLFSPDGKRLVSGSSDKTSKLWDVTSGEQIGAFPLDEPRTLMGIAFSPCGSVIATGMFGGLRLWCAETLTTLLEIPQPQTQKPYALAFSPCGKYLASGTWWQREKGMEKMAIRLWDVATGEEITTFWGHPTDVQSLAFSPDSTLLASGSHDCTILLWDVKPFIGA